MRVLCVATAGGHLQELHRLLPRLSDETIDPVWITHDTAQSRSLLAGAEVHYVHYATTHDPVTTLRNVPAAVKLVKKNRFDAVVSTGSSVAVSFLPLARAKRMPTHYIESATRLDSPSLTGKILARLPGIHLYTQHAVWADDSWHHRGSVFDGYRAEPITDTKEIRRIVVSVGSARDYGYRRLIERLVEIVPDGVDVLWQTGSTDVTGLDIDARPSVPFDELAAANADADVVVIHAGIGSSMTALEQGHMPVICPRRAHRKEHIDDHQVENGRLLGDQGLAVTRDADELTWADLVEAAAHRIVSDESPAPFRLS